MTSHQIDISDFEKDPRLFLFTSLTAGSSHIITATSRLETILKANKIPFQAIDLATDEKARRLWQRRARERKLPGLVKEGFVVGDLEEVEEWNEFGELKENIGPVPANTSAADHTVKTGVSIAPPIPVNPTATQGTTKISTPPQSAMNKAPQPGVDESKFRALPGAAEIAARNKASQAASAPAAAAEPSPEQKEGKSVIDENAPPGKAAESMTSAPKEKEESINAAKKILGDQEAGGDSRRGVEHLSAPPSGMVTPNPEPEDKDKVKDEGSAGVEDQVEGLSVKEDEVGEGKLTHRGSEVKEAPVEEVKKVESENSLVEAAEEVDEGKDAPATAMATEGKAESVQASDAGEGKAAEEVREQSAKEGGDAGKSVGD